jgi:ADP-ribose pyrophosphatase YjhB (NUDIX family)
MSELHPAFTVRQPAGEDRPRRVCDHCGFIDYVNPRIVVGSVATWDAAGEETRVLLCRRAIEPRRGFWTLPAGYMETGESTWAAAAREAREEAFAEIAIDALIAVYDIPRISQVQLMHRARLLSPEIAPGDESLEVALFRWADIPWSELAFPSVHWTLHQWRATRDDPAPVPGRNPPGEEDPAGL